MTAADQIREILHSVASSLQWPVLLSLLMLCVITLIAVGRFAKEFADRIRGCTKWIEHLKSELAAISSRSVSQRDSQRGSQCDIELEEAMQRAEAVRASKIARLRMVVRIGPSLGLMGTLIPMASALQGLSEGNLPSLASNMVTAFAATVIGLSLSTIAYAITAVQDAWLKADAREVAFVAERLLREVRDAEPEVNNAVR